MIERKILSRASSEIATYAGAGVVYGAFVEWFQQRLFKSDEWLFIDHPAIVLPLYFLAGMLLVLGLRGIAKDQLYNAPFHPV